MAADQDDSGEKARPAEARDGVTKTLLGAALQSAVRAASETAGSQVALFEMADALPDDAEAGGVAPIEQDGKRGPGRPPGARNKATEELRRFVRARYGDPGLKLMEVIFTDPKALARAMGAPSAWDVRVKQMDWAIRMMPYFWQAMPAEVKIQAKGALAIGMAAMPGGLQAGDRIVAADPFTALLNMATDQGVGADEADPSNAEPSNADGKTIDGTKA